MQSFQTYPTYSGEDLELTVDSKGTHWRLWSPKNSGGKSDSL